MHPIGVWSLFNIQFLFLFFSAEIVYGRMSTWTYLTLPISATTIQYVGDVIWLVVKNTILVLIDVE